MEIFLDIFYCKKHVMIFSEIISNAGFLRKLGCPKNKDTNYFTFYGKYKQRLLFFYILIYLFTVILLYEVNENIISEYIVLLFIFSLPYSLYDKKSSIQ